MSTHPLAHDEKVTHVVTFDHPNSLMPVGYGTASVEDGDDEDEILRQALMTDPHQNEPTQEGIDAMRETATIYRVAGATDDDDAISFSYAEANTLYWALERLDVDVGLNEREAPIFVALANLVGQPHGFEEYES